MVRIKPSTIWQASKLNRFLPFLLPECRSIHAARQELRWIQDESNDDYQVWKRCKLRYRHYPLQYILGSQPFESLNIKCKPGVLIPRWETEEWATDLAHRLPKNRQIHVLDLCTGTGCIPLLIKHIRPDAVVKAVDCSPLATGLAYWNSKSLGISIQVIQGDILEHNSTVKPQKVDLITCNPPYISQSTFVKETSRSVKLFEPKLALIGCFEFYADLIDHQISRAEAFVYEVGELSQCEYVCRRIVEDPILSKVWRVGFRLDANSKPRVVYGYRRVAITLDWPRIFEEFGELKN
ncbi:LANO_0H07558g1_1 [Lachancea nothofagi CBS 11611]|uniref:peptide chain release factor N(5)-glutamine methyltransferase n=1 Tax=Lachancea nothofagi CBS 11611 TaxID=1266666 RepID=A0A1G4KLI8_9SACH|nr:LANO_0H07558g1_1 [Lachancea nothofagi CBS 11611]